MSNENDRAEFLGGVRVIVPHMNKILLVKQIHNGKEIWMAPGGAIETGETSQDAAIREVLEETGLIVHIKRLLWHVEEVSERGQRFVNYFLASIIGGKEELGEDPELGDAQVLDEMAYFSKSEIKALENVYPEALRDEVFKEIEIDMDNRVYRIRENIPQ